MTLRSLLKQYLIPPGYFWLFKGFPAKKADVTKTKEAHDAQFRGEEFSLLREALRESRYYGEYGVGASTT